jgi:gamma-glutamyltranspeptidase/glutathione hydrolase
MDLLNDDAVFLGPAWAPDFAIGGRRIKTGDKMTRKRYADTLEIIRDGGADSFYSGPIANDIVGALKKQGGILTLQDLKDYRVVSRPVRELDFGDYKIFGCSAPSGGPVGLNIINVMKGYSDTPLPSSINLTTHRLDEAFRFAYGLVSARYFDQQGLQLQLLTSL